MLSGPDRILGRDNKDEQEAYEHLKDQHVEYYSNAHKPQKVERNQVFISYSHKDKEWLEKLQTFLKSLERNGSIATWDDRRIQAGDEWRKEIEKALASAKVAVLLVSQDFLASDFIHENELPPLLDAAENEGLTIIWVPISHSTYQDSPIEKYQAAHEPNHPLDSLSASEQNKALVEICKKIKKAFGG